MFVSGVQFGIGFGIGIFIIGVVIVGCGAVMFWWLFRDKVAL